MARGWGKAVVNGNFFPRFFYVFANFAPLEYLGSMFSQEINGQRIWVILRVGAAFKFGFFEVKWKVLIGDAKSL